MLSAGSKAIQTEQQSITSITKDFEACNHRLASYLEQLSQLDAKLQGQYPTPATTSQGVPPTSDGLIGGLNQTRGTFASLLDEFERLLGALENRL